MNCLPQSPRPSPRPTPTEPGPRIESLGDRHLEVFGPITQGLSTPKIAERLLGSVSSVEIHREKIQRQSQRASGTELVS